MGINQSFNTSIYGGGGLSTDVPQKGPVAIAGHIYQTDPKQCSRKTLEVLRGTSDVQNEPGEQSFNFHGLWKRNIKDWRRGAGQLYFDDADSIPTRDRFFASKGIDGWTPRQITLLQETSLVVSTANTNLKVVPCGASIGLVSGATVKTAPIAGDFSSFTTVTAAATINDMTSDAINVYLAIPGNAIQKGLIGGAVANFGTFQATAIGYGNGRLLAAALNRLVEIGAAGAFGGAGQLDFSHPNSLFVWRGILTTPSAIYAWGDVSGVVSEVYSITIDPTTGALKPPTLAWTPPLGEAITAMLWDSVVMVIGTTLGFHLATQATNLGLTSGALIPIARGVTALCALGRYVWFSWTNYDGVSTGIGRMDLAEMVDAADLVPAYASDLMATTQGVVSGVGTSVDAPSFTNRRIFAVQGVGFYRALDTVVAQGTLDPGWILFSTVENKVAVSVDLRLQPLVGSVAVSLVVDQDTATPIPLSTIAAQGAVQPQTPLTANNIRFERLKVMLTLNRFNSSSTVGPIVRRVTPRAIPVPIRTDRIVVAVRSFERVESPTMNNSQPLMQEMDLLAEFMYLKGIEAQGLIIRYQEGISSYDVVIDGIELQGEKFTEDGAYMQGMMGVALLTINPMS